MKHDNYFSPDMWKVSTFYFIDETESGI